jgi:hypothetical protein
MGNLNMELAADRFVITLYDIHASFIPFEHENQISELCRIACKGEGKHQNYPTVKPTV